jgi:chaperone modulatory protein CbpM
MEHTHTATVVEDGLALSLLELCRACRAPEDQVRLWVFEGVLEPIGNSPQEWQFVGDALRRAKIAATLTQQLEINPPGIALVLDLLERIDALQAAQRRRGAF